MFFFVINVLRPRSPLFNRKEQAQPGPEQIFFFNLAEVATMLIHENTNLRLNP
jgi:hypothetical protein